MVYLQIVQPVIPAKVGIYFTGTFLDPCFRRDDKANAN
jgi:hypothetical protein